MMALARINAVRSATWIRHFRTSAPAASVTDPIQSLFLTKIQEYDTLKKQQLVDISPEMAKEMKNELDRVARVYGGAEGVDMTQFPQFTFPEAKVDPINM